MLRDTNCTLDLISDPKKFSMFHAGIRGWVSMISTRYAKANHPYLAAFEAAQPNSYIIYLDANNLSGWALSQPMPIGGFEWMTANEAREIDCLTQTQDQPVGYSVEASTTTPSKCTRRSKTPAGPGASRRANDHFQ